MTELWERYASEATAADAVGYLAELRAQEFRVRVDKNEIKTGSVSHKGRILLGTREYAPDDVVIVECSPFPVRHA